MATSWVEICNLALISLGAETITQLEEDTNNAQLCRAIYRGAADEVLSEHEFACAEARQDLNKLAAEPVGVLWHFQYQLPVNFLKIRSVDPDSPYERSGPVIFSNQESLTLVYTYQVTNPQALDAHVGRAISAKIAFILAPKIVHKDKFTAYSEGQYERALMKARWAEIKKKKDQDVDLLSDQSLPDNWEEVH